MCVLLIHLLPPVYFQNLLYIINTVVMKRNINIFLLFALLLSLSQSARAQYCTSGFFSSGCAAYGDACNSVVTSGGTTNISNLLTGCTNASSGSYTYYSTMSHTGVQGGTVGFVITNAPGDYEYYNMWVDWNQDGDFLDANEAVFATTGSIAPGSTASGTFNIPTTATLGTTRLRVRCNYGSNGTPCGSSSWGEVEDYNFIVMPNCTTPPAPTATSPVNGCLGQAATLTASAASGTLKWYAGSTGGTSLGTGTSFTTPVVNGNITYYVAAENGACASARVAINIVANPSPSITAQPSDAISCPGNNTSFSVTAANASSYQWQYNTGAGYVNVPATAPYSNVNSATLNITGTTIGQNGYLFRCVAISGPCSVTSVPATLTVSATPTITAQSNDDTICAEDTASFMVVTTGGSLTYQWQVNTGAGFVPVGTIPPYYGANTNQLIIANGSPAMTGYQYRCFVAISACPAAGINSIPSILTVKPKPDITVQPLSDSVNASENSSFSIQATGLNLSYQWQLNDTGIYVDLFDNYVYSGTKTNTLHISNTYQSKNNFRYRCLVSGECLTGYDTSDEAILKVGPPLSVNDLKAYGKITLYPNPVTGNDMILKMEKAGTKDVTIRITDQLGRVSVLEYTRLSGVNDTHVNVSKLSPGIYSLQLYDNQYRCIGSALFTKQ